MEQCSTDGCTRPPRRGTTRCKVCYTKEWRDRQGECSLGHCDRQVNASGLCTTHYNRKREGRPDWDAPIPRRIKRDGKCAKAGCPEPVQACGYCNVHYARVLRLGDPGPVGLLKAAKGEGSEDGRGYRVITVGGKRYLEHRWVMEQMLGRPLKPDEEVHHWNRIRNDNDPSNLELWATPQPRGGRVEDLVRFYVERYPEVAARILAEVR